MRTTHQDRIDSLISHFWRNGYLTVSRKFGTYLPPPQPVGNYEIDAIGKYKKAYVFGIVLSENDFKNPRIMNKIKYLSSQNTKYSNRKVKLYLGVQKQFVEVLNNMLLELPKETRENVRIILVN